MKEAFAEIDLTSNVLEVMMSSTAPNFRLATYGYAGTTQVHNYTFLFSFFYFVFHVYILCSLTIQKILT